MSVPIESVEARLERQELPVKYEFVRLQNARIAYAEALRGTSANGTTDDGGGSAGNDGNPPEMSQKKSNNAIKRVRYILCPLKARFISTIFTYLNPKSNNYFPPIISKKKNRNELKLENKLALDCASPMPKTHAPMALAANIATIYKLICNLNLQITLDSVHFQLRKSALTVLCVDGPERIRMWILY